MNKNFFYTLKWKKKIKNLDKKNVLKIKEIIQVKLLC